MDIRPVLLFGIGDFCCDLIASLPTYGHIPTVRSGLQHDGHYAAAESHGDSAEIESLELHFSSLLTGLFDTIETNRLRLTRENVHVIPSVNFFIVASLPGENVTEQIRMVLDNSEEVFNRQKKYTICTYFYILIPGLDASRSDLAGASDQLLFLESLYQSDKHIRFSAVNLVDVRRSLIGRKISSEHTVSVLLDALVFQPQIADAMSQVSPELLTRVKNRHPCFTGSAGLYQLSYFPEITVNCMGKLCAAELLHDCIIGEPAVLAENIVMLKGQISVEPLRQRIGTVLADVSIDENYTFDAEHIGLSFSTALEIAEFRNLRQHTAAWEELCDTMVPALLRPFTEDYGTLLEAAAAEMEEQLDLFIGSLKRNIGQENYRSRKIGDTIEDCGSIMKETRQQLRQITGSDDTAALFDFSDTDRSGLQQEKVALSLRILLLELLDGLAQGASSASVREQLNRFVKRFENAVESLSAAADVARDKYNGASREFERHWVQCNFLKRIFRTFFRKYHDESDALASLRKDMELTETRCTDMISRFKSTLLDDYFLKLYIPAASLEAFSAVMRKRLETIKAYITHLRENEKRFSQQGGSPVFETAEFEESIITQDTIRSVYGEFKPAGDLRESFLKWYRQKTGRNLDLAEHALKDAQALEDLVAEFSSERMNFFNDLNLSSFILNGTESEIEAAIDVILERAAPLTPRRGDLPIPHEDLVSSCHVFSSQEELALFRPCFTNRRPQPDFVEDRKRNSVRVIRQEYGVPLPYLERFVVKEN